VFAVLLKHLPAARKFALLWRLAVAVVLPLLACVSLVWAFAEEPLPFRDPYTGRTGDELEEEVSTIHNDLTDASEPSPDSWPSSSDWGEPVSGITTTYAIYKQDFVYGTEPFTITDMRDDANGKIYSDKEGYEIRALTVYRAHDGEALLDHQPVMFFVHGGAWVDGYRDWYEFVAYSFTGEMGWVSVVMDYRLTSDEVFIADEHCPDRATCALPENEPYRTKSAWYPDNVDDVADAFQWVLDHIGDHGGEVSQIVVFGHSAGGHLVSLLGTHSDYETSLRPAIQGVVSMSGAYELNSLNKAFWSSAVTQTFHGGFGSTELLEEASPASYVVSAASLPPFYILYAEDEVLSITEQNVVFGGKLEALGFDVTTSYLAGYSHVSEMEAIAFIDETPTQLIVNWMEDVLQQRVYLPLVER
jgi:acetyl esterase/lipase